VGGVERVVEHLLGLRMMERTLLGWTRKKRKEAVKQGEE